MDNNEKIGIIAFILALICLSAVYNLSTTNAYNNQGVPFNKTVLEFHQCCAQTFHALNISNLSINRDKIYIINIIGNGTGNTNLGIFFNNDLNYSNYTRQYVLADGAYLVSALDHSADFSAWDAGHSAQSKLVIQKASNGQVRIIVEGNFGGGYINPNLLRFFNMQMSYNNQIDDITNISIITSGALANGIDFYLFKG